MFLPLMDFVYNITMVNFVHITVWTNKYAQFKLTAFYCIRYLLQLKTFSQSQKSNSKSRLTTGFSLKSNFQTGWPPSPASQPAGKVSKKQYTAIYPKQKFFLCIRWISKMFGNKPRPKNHQFGVKNTKNLLIQDFFKPEFSNSEFSTLNWSQKSKSEYGLANRFSLK